MYFINTKYSHRVFQIKYKIHLEKKYFKYKIKIGILHFVFAFEIFVFQIIHISEYMTCISVFIFNLMNVCMY